MGTQITTYLLDEGGTKQYSRSKINTTATKFYTKLYKDSKPKFKRIEIKKNLEEPAILKTEVEEIEKNLRNNKAVGCDSISNEQLKLGGEDLLRCLTSLYNKILREQKLPKKWLYSNIILLHKKGNRNATENYRPISLSSTLAKILSKIITNRIMNDLMGHQPKEQVGFRRGYSTTDHLFTLNQLIEKSQEYQIPIHLAFIDYSKAFDSLKHEFMLSALKKQGVSEVWINLITEMYNNLEAKKITDKIGPNFPIKKGVKQGDPLSPLLFNSALEEIFGKLNWENKGININGEKMNNLRFADDVVLISESDEELKSMIKEINEAGQKAGLMINLEKTKTMSSNHELQIKIDNKNIENTNEIIYLGQTISLENRTAKEINRKIALAWKKFWQLKDIMKGPFLNDQKSKIFNSCITPVLTYSSQTWSLTKNEVDKLSTNQNSMERSMINV